MWILFLTIGLSIGVVIVCWSIVLGKKWITTIVTCLTITIAFLLGITCGVAWENFRNYDRYVWRFSQYSTHLRQLIEQQKYNELTNDIVIFDTKFNDSHQDWRDLQDATFQILQIDPYFQDTNTIELDTPTNNTQGSKEK